MGSSWKFLKRMGGGQEGDEFSAFFFSLCFICLYLFPPFGLFGMLGFRVWLDGAVGHEAGRPFGWRDPLPFFFFFFLF